MSRYHRLLYVTVAAISILSCKSEYLPYQAQILSKAFFCLSDQKSIYSSCNKAYRLNQNGYINVPNTATDQFCYGPCLAETQGALYCIQASFGGFSFFNGATIGDIRSTLQGGCSHTSERGNFNVEEYIQGSSSGNEALKPNMLTAFAFAFVVVLPTLACNF